MGGMGAVYKAHDIEVDRAVGLKIIRPDLAGNPAILARFKQELILARQVTHRNIIRIYDLSEAEGVKFITMEFIEGEDLRGILTRRGKLPPDEAIDIIRQSCMGLQAAHVEGVIHRDLKPSNIMRDTAGRVVIMDFGLAKTVQSDGMTQTGMMIGTMEYMSPEQAMGSELDARSDIFAIGLIFYELINGTMPYRADSAIASLVRRTQERATPLHELDPTVPAAISAIVAKCLERDREEPLRQHARPAGRSRCRAGPPSTLQWHGTECLTPNCAQRRRSYPGRAITGDSATGGFGWQKFSAQVAGCRSGGVVGRAWNWRLRRVLGQAVRRGRQLFGKRRRDVTGHHSVLQRVGRCQPELAFVQPFGNAHLGYGLVVRRPAGVAKPVTASACAT